MRIGIVGVGLVGETLQYGFERIGHEVVPFDTKMRLTAITDVLKTQLTFICVPTPQSADGSCDVSIVDGIVADLAAHHYKGLAVIKSTVPPGTTDRLHARHALALAFCPEFLRERARYTDFVENHDICIVGAYRWEDFELIRVAHGQLPQKIVHLAPIDAEFCKYFSNVLNALRIVFANQFYDVCAKAGADYQAIKDAMVGRQNIGNSYLDCSEKFRGFGGSCLPKDTAAFVAFVKQLGLDVPLFEQIVELNKRYIGEKKATDNARAA